MKKLIALVIVEFALLTGCAQQQVVSASVAPDSTKPCFSGTANKAQILAAIEGVVNALDDDPYTVTAVTRQRLGKHFGIEFVQRDAQQRKSGLRWIKRSHDGLFFITLTLPDMPTVDPQFSVIWKSHPTDISLAYKSSPSNNLNTDCVTDQDVTTLLEAHRWTIYPKGTDFSTYVRADYPGSIQITLLGWSKPVGDKAFGCINGIYIASDPTHVLP